MKEKIIKATAKILSQKGPEDVSTRAVCAAVGITAPTLYHYFIDKNDLLNTVTKSAFEKTKKKKSENLDQDPYRCILKIWDNYIDFAFTEPEFYSVMVKALAQGEVHAVGQTCFQQTIGYFEEAEKLKLLNYSAKEAASIYQASALGVASLSLLSEDKQASRILSEQAKAVVVQGLFRM
jgi:AcrR family transcriptional regulator